MRTEIKPGQDSDYTGYDLVMADNLPQPAVLVADRGYESAKNLERYRDRQRSALASGKQSTGPSSYPPHTMRKNATIIDVRLAMAFGKERLKPRHLRVTLPEQIAHQGGLLALLNHRTRP